MKKYTAIIIDDEEDNIELLSFFIEKFCLNINIIAKTGTIESGVSLINEFKPDILYLDIKLDKGTSFNILEQVNHTNMAVIFITAFKDFAIEAIKVNAIDYILKPLSIEDVILATNKAIEKLEKQQIKEKLEKETKDYIAIHTTTSIEIIKTKELFYCESEKTYTTFYLKDKKITASKNLGYFEDLLNRNFLRIHNSYIVNINFIKKVHKKDGFYCEMINGKKIPVSKRKQSLLVGL